MLLTIFGLVDVLFGGVLAASPYFKYAGVGIIGILGILALIKGIYSTLAAASAGLYFDLMGWLDLLVGLLLLVSSWGVTFNWFLWIGIFMVIKGVYSILMEILGD